MSLHRFLTLSCDGALNKPLARFRRCQSELVGRHDLSTQKARSLAVKQGWSREGGEDYCPRCTTRRARQGAQ